MTHLAEFLKRRMKVEEFQVRNLSSYAIINIAFPYKFLALSYYFFCMTWKHNVKRLHLSIPSKIWLDLQRKFFPGHAKTGT